MADSEWEARILRFEQAWQRAGPCSITDALDCPFAPPDEQRVRWLVELICVDLEYRWRNPRSDGPALWEHYLAQFPELGPLDQLPVELIGEEYRVRHRWGDRPPHGEFLSRFPGRPERMRLALLAIDAELEDESAEWGGTPILMPGPPPDPIVRVPLLSEHDVLLQRMIGAGRMGKVYQAWHVREERDIAVKFLRKSFLRQPAVVERFIGEARTVARLRHPHIVGIEGMGRTTGGAYFLVMELVNGPNLALISQARPITVNEAIDWAIQTCGALEHAHARGIIHCDLKPANLLHAADGRIRVTDFGLARSLSGETPWAAEVEGTAPFMAPEQVSRHWGQIDERTDVYGIGAVVYALVTGRPPWIGRRLPDVLADVISAAAVVPAACLRPDVPMPLSDLCQCCLSKPARERYPSVQQLRSALVDLRGLGTMSYYCEDGAP